ncbi:hypothetical protein LUZ60_009938 [Juncus effusus]|nr:hypothetical protein LUZ60_009938 [Juncus effusus]
MAILQMSLAFHESSIPNLNNRSNITSPGIFLSIFTQTKHTSTESLTSLFFFITCSNPNQNPKTLLLKMDNSCIDESSAESGTVPVALPPFPLQRMGSATSGVIDPVTETGTEAESKKLPSSQYKGVVPQPNGRWGAQIYERHQRVWLGTFGMENEAARAYDVAAQRFRGKDAVTNFKPLSESNETEAAELAFISNHSKAEIVDMLRKHTYHDELSQSLRSTMNELGKCNVTKMPFPFSTQNTGLNKELLFDKVVTPSDVGKLNRLVIPKQQAEKHFPLKGVNEGTVGTAGTGDCKGVLLNFEDGSGKVWRFRYSYWHSSQSYVLTKGWSRFVKEKSLKAGDSVSFFRSSGTQKQLYIHCKLKENSVHVPVLARKEILKNLPKVVRLFGVNIEFEMVNNGESGKRGREMELFPQGKMLIKKQRLCDNL